MEHMTEEMARAKLFEDGYDCAQTVLNHFAEDLDLDEETALKLASGFGGGAVNSARYASSSRTLSVRKGFIT